MISRRVIFLSLLTFVFLSLGLLVQQGKAQNFCVQYINCGSISSLGMNLSGNQEEMPFLNVMKMTIGWFTENSSGVDTHEESSFYANCIDSNQYPTTLGACQSLPTHTFTQVSWYAFLDGAPYPAGTYVLLFTGAQNTSASGTIVFGNRYGTETTCTTGRCLVTMDGSSELRATITATDPNSIGNYINNIAVIYAPDSTSGSVGVNETNFLAGNCQTKMGPLCINPLWLAAMSPFKTFRMMDWGVTLSNQNVNWADRSLQTWGFWLTTSEFDARPVSLENGMPVEAMVAACNAVGANCWVNLPCLSTKAYAQSEAALIASTLNSGLKVYDEFCNEVWNNIALSTTIQNGMIANGEAAYPLGGTAVYSSGTTYSAGQYVTCTAATCAGSPSNYEIYESLSNGNVGHNPYTDAGVHWQNTNTVCPGGAFSGFSYLFTDGILGAVSAGQAFKTSLGNRSVRLMASQFSYGNGARIAYQGNWLASNCGGTASLFSGTAAANLDAMATAPYFGSSLVPLAWTAQADSGLTYFFEEQNTGGLLPTAIGTGNCGNGAGFTCDSGGNTAFTLTSPGGNIPATPANGTCLGMEFNATIGASATLAVDGGNSYPLVNEYGTALGSGSILINAQEVFCFTNQTSVGSVTAGWYYSAFGYSNGVHGGWLNATLDTWLCNEEVVAGSPGCSGNYLINPLPLVAYESGQNYSGGSNTTYNTWFYSANRDSRMGTAYTTYYTGLRAQTSGLLNIFNDIAAFTGQEFGNLETITQNLSTSPRYQAGVNFAN